jgi:hypothetical protein
MNKHCVCTYKLKRQAEQFAKEFSKKFGVEVDIKDENGCYSIYTSSGITHAMIHFIYKEFLLLPENRSIPNARYWHEREAQSSYPTGDTK